MDSANPPRTDVTVSSTAPTPSTKATAAAAFVSARNSRVPPTAHASIISYVVTVPMTARTAVTSNFVKVNFVFLPAAKQCRSMAHDSPPLTSVSQSAPHRHGWDSTQLLHVNGVRRDRKMLIVGQQQRGLNTSCFSACYLLRSHSGLLVLCQFTHQKIVYFNQYRRWHFTSKVICHRVNLRSSLICGCTGVEMVIGILRQVPQLSRLKFLDHNLTSENVQRPQWPQNLIFFFGLL